MTGLEKFGLVFIAWGLYGRMGTTDWSQFVGLTLMVLGAAMLLWDKKEETV